MPQKRAAKKALRKSLKNRARNLLFKDTIKTAVKELKKALADKNLAKVQEALKQTCKILDKAVSKNLFHANKAARRKSRLNKLVNKFKTQGLTNPQDGKAKPEGSDGK